MEKIHLIVECSMNSGIEEKLNSIAKIIYALPIINSYAVEISPDMIKHLHGFKGIKTVSNCSMITAQHDSIRATLLRSSKEPLPTGKGIGIAILDTGISPVSDFILPENRISCFLDFVGGQSEPYDDNAHGTHVTGIAAGNGYNSDGKFIGIAPEASIISLKVLDSEGNGNAADMLAGIQWITDNKERYNIRIANLSVGTKDIGRNDPLVRGCDYAWDNGIVIVAAAGNEGPEPGSVTSPGISRKIITVGASDDVNSVKIRGNTLVNFSGRGPTSECIVKPDIIAPGSKIISCLSTTAKIADREDCIIIKDSYIEMSGTSMAAPVVSGAIALLLEKHPYLEPNDVKLLIKMCAKKMNYAKNQQGWGILSIERLLELGDSYAI